MSFGFGFSLPAGINYGAEFGAGATLALDFTSGNQTLDPRITFTRASSATRTNSSGLIQTMGNNVARFDYNPVTLAPKGLLIEEQRTNLVTYSEQFNNAAWTKTGSSVSSNVIVSPDGTINADKLIEDTSTGAHECAQSVTLVASTTYALSVFAKADTRTLVRVAGRSFGSWSTFPSAIFNLSAGTVTSISGVGTPTITSIGNGWYRCVVFGTTSATNAGVTVGLVSTGTTSSYTGDGTSGLYIWGAQLEAGAFATSYIPTVASQVTRSADVAVMTGTNFSSWYNATEGSMYAQYDWLGDSSFDYMFAVNDTTGNNLIGIGLSNANIYRGIVVTSGTTVASMTAGGVGVIGQVYSQAMAYKLNDFALAGGGVMRGTDTAGAVPVVTQASFNGSSGISNLFNGHIRRIAYYPRRLANTELQVITS